MGSGTVQRRSVVAADMCPRSAAGPADGTKVTPVEPDCVQDVIQWLEANPTPAVDKLLPSRAARRTTKRKAAAANSSADPPDKKATFKRPVRKRGDPGEPLPVPADMPEQARPKPDEPRGLFNYTVHGAGEHPASINVQLRTKAFFLNRVAGGAAYIYIYNRALCGPFGPRGLQ